MVTFGKALKARREALGFSRGDFASRVGLSIDYLTDIENRGKIPSVKVLAVLVRLASSKDKQQALALNTAQDSFEWTTSDQGVALNLILHALGIRHEDLTLLMPFAKLRPGSLFVAIVGAAGMKTEYVQGAEPGSQCLCVTLETHEQT